MLEKNIFKTIVEHTPLISIDFVIRQKDKILLGKRKNKPALGYYFTIGGRIFKNESIKEAQKRILREEIGIIDITNLIFLGVYEHFYEDSFLDDDISTHYVNLLYELILYKKLENIPKKQHSNYKWFSVEELLESDEVNIYAKEYFKK